MIRRVRSASGRQCSRPSLNADAAPRSSEEPEGRRARHRLWLRSGTSAGVGLRAPPQDAGPTTLTLGQIVKHLESSTFSFTWHSWSEIGKQEARRATVDS